MDSPTVVDDSVLEFFGELYRHEDRTFRSRVQFQDYLKLSLRAWPEEMRHRPAEAGQYHAHQCACGTFITCTTPDAPLCNGRPRCAMHREPLCAIDLVAGLMMEARG